MVIGEGRTASQLNEQLPTVDQTVGTILEWSYGLLETSQRIKQDVTGESESGEASAPHTSSLLARLAKIRDVISDAQANFNRVEQALGIKPNETRRIG